ncbi:MAG: hypothetical protein QOK07_772 [Gemmatimonadaceae bacterium]|nr:hypothetical protein [Gemmatimonadaceae bacterium]
MQKCNPFSLGAYARCFVDELNAGSAAALERRVQIVDRKADVMDSRTALGHEARDWRGGIIGFQQLNKRVSRAESRYPGAVGTVEADLSQSQYVPKERETLGDCLDRDPDVRNAGAARSCWGH